MDYSLLIFDNNNIGSSLIDLSFSFFPLPLFTYQIFNGDDMNYQSVKNYGHCLDVSCESIMKLKTGLNLMKMLKESDRQNSHTFHQSPLASIITLLKSALIDFKWTWTETCIDAIISPAKIATKPNAPVNVRNYMFLISPCPKTVNDLQFFTSNQVSNMSTSNVNTLNDLIDVVQHELLDGSLWKRFVDNRISVNWIDVSNSCQQDVSSKSLQVSSKR